MAKRPQDVDVRQSVKDIFFTKNAYRLNDNYVIRDGKKHPFAILCPGGGYMVVCSFIEGVPIAKKLNEKGISVFILYYRVKKQAHFPAPIEDLAHAVRDICDAAEAYGLDTFCYSVWGASAGGHLAACFGTERIGYRQYGLPKPGMIVLSYPVISMKPELTHKGSHDAFVGRNASEADEELASADLQVTADYPPTFIWCGDADKVVDPENTKRMVRALQDAGVPCSYEIIPGAEHGVGPGTGTPAEGWIDRACSCWMKIRDAEGIK